jgi:hypothetical protein
MVSKLVLILWHFSVLCYCCRWRHLPPAAPPISSVLFLGMCLSLCPSLPVTFTPFPAVQIPAATFPVRLNTENHHHTAVKSYGVHDDHVSAAIFRCRRLHAPLLSLCVSHTCRRQISAWECMSNYPATTALPHSEVFFIIWWLGDYIHRWLLMVPSFPVDDHFDGDFCFVVTSFMHMSCMLQLKEGC